MDRQYIMVAVLALVLGVSLGWFGATLTKRSPHATPARQVPNESLVLKVHDEESDAQPQHQQQTAVRTSATPAPKELARGRITKIDASGFRLVEIDLGKDAGLDRHTCLEVYRAGATKDYVGTLRVLDVFRQRSACRLVSTNPLKKEVPNVGDQVVLRGER